MTQLCGYETAHLHLTEFFHVVPIRCLQKFIYILPIYIKPTCEFSHLVNIICGYVFIEDNDIILHFREWRKYVNLLLAVCGVTLLCSNNCS